MSCASALKVVYSSSPVYKRCSSQGGKYSAQCLQVRVQILSLNTFESLQKCIMCQWKTALDYNDIAIFLPVVILIMNFTKGFYASKPWRQKKSQYWLCDKLFGQINSTCMMQAWIIISITEGSVMYGMLLWLIVIVFDLNETHTIMTHIQITIQV